MLEDFSFSFFLFMLFFILLFEEAIMCERQYLFEEGFVKLFLMKPRGVCWGVYLTIYLKKKTLAIIL